RRPDLSRARRRAPAARIGRGARWAGYARCARAGATASSGAAMSGGRVRAGAATGVVHGRQQLVATQGLGQDTPRSELLCAVEEVDAGVASSPRDRDDLRRARPGELEDQVQAGFVGKEDVGDDEIGLMRVVPHGRVPRTGRAEDLVTDLGEDVAEHVEEV